MITPEEIVDLAEYLKRKEIPSSSYQLFAAQQILSRWGQDAVDPASFIQLSNALGPIFCRTAEEQQQFQDLYLEWLRQRSHRPRERRVSVEPDPTPQPETPTIHWRIKLAGLGLLLVAILAGWFDYQDFRIRQVVGQVLADGKAVPHATVHLGKGFSDESEPEPSKTDDEGRFVLPFQAKDMPLEITVKAETYLTAKIPVGEAIKANRNWFYLNPITLEDKLDIGSIQLAKEPKAPPPKPLPKPDLTPEPPPSELSIQKIAELSVPPPSWTARLEGWKALGAWLPLVLSLLWLAYRKLRTPGLKRQAARIPPELKRVQIQTETHHLFPSISLRHLTQRLRHTRFVESTELDVAKTIHCTIQRGGLFTPVYGGRQEPGYVALIDRTTLADHQAHLAAQLVKDLAKGYVLVRQYEFDEHPTMLQRVDPLRPVQDPASENLAGVSSLEVMPLEDLHAKFPSRRLLCFGDPRLCFDPLTGKLRPWVETLEGWDERFWLSSNTDRLWGRPERILSRRGFHVVPLSHLGLQVLAGMLEQQEARRSFDPKSKQKMGGSHERLPDRWLERHPPSPERLRTLLTDLEVEFEEDHAGRSEERGREGMRWLAACATYPEIHWALTLEWGLRLFGQGPATETLLPKLTRLVWFRHAFMPDWLRQALYDRLTKEEAERLSVELADILSAATTESSEGLSLTIATRATGATKPETAAHPHKKTRSLREWWTHLRRTLRLRAMGEKAEPGSPLRDYVTLQYLSGKQGKARGLIARAPKALLNVLFPKGQPWLGFRPFVLPVAAMVVTGGLWDWFDPIPVPFPSTVQAVLLSQDGNQVAVGREDGHLQVWDWKARREVLDVAQDQVPIWSLVWSPDGRWVLTGSRDNTARLWDTTTGQEVALFQGHTAGVSAAAFSPDGRWVLTGSRDNTARLWDTTTGQEVALFQGHTAGVSAVAFSPDGRWVLTGSRDNTARLWDTTTGQEVALFQGHTAEVSAVAFSPDGRLFLTGGLDGTAKLWSADAGKLIATTGGQIKFDQDSNTILTVSFSPDGRLILVRARDETIRILWSSDLRPVINDYFPQLADASVHWSELMEIWFAVPGINNPEIWSLHIPEGLLKSTSSDPSSTRIPQVELEKAMPKLPINEVPMVYVAGGNFTMGHIAGWDDQRPAHQIFLDSFWIDTFEVTVEQYAKFLQATNHNPPKFWKSRATERRAKYPVVGVDWNDAKKFCEWAGKRLPTEAEWEMAARGTDGRFYPWGDELPTPNRVNFNKDLSGSVYGNNLTPVGSFVSGKSPFGVHDMSGNVWEWVSDWYNEQYYAKSPKLNPIGPSSGTKKVLRGGGWADPIELLSSINRYKDLPKHRSASVGFRCARAGERVVPSPKTTIQKSFLERLIREPSRQVMAGGSIDQLHKNIPEIRNGPFTYAFLEGLERGLADVNRDGFIQTSELFEYIRAKVTKESFGKEFPSLSNLSGAQGDFVFENPRSFSSSEGEIPTPKSPSLGKALAITIGISNYRNGLSSLKYPVNDARAVETLLKELGFAVHTLLNVTREEILRSLNQFLLAKAQEYDRILIYFSGHGKDIEIADGKPSGYLLPSNTDPGEILIKGINFREILDMVDLSDTKHVLVVLDVPVQATSAQRSDIDRLSRDKRQDLGKDPTVPNKKIPKKPLPPPNSKNGALRDSKPTRSVQRQQESAQQVQQQEVPQRVEEPPAQIEEPPVGNQLNLKVEPFFNEGEFGVESETLPTKITGKDGAVMVLVPAGEFTMGAREDDKLAQADERPTHTVYVDSFYIDQFEVTTTLYAKFFQEKKRDPPRYWTETVLQQHSNKPVVGVTWDDANAYCEWAAKRLPTEEEWEKAARGTDQRLYPWGNEGPNEKLANFNNCCDFKDYGVLKDVGSFEGGKSPFGAYDMGGERVGMGGEFVRGEAVSTTGQLQSSGPKSSRSGERRIQSTSRRVLEQWRRGHAVDEPLWELPDVREFLLRVSVCSGHPLTLGSFPLLCKEGSRGGREAGRTCPPNLMIPSTFF